MNTKNFIWIGMFAGSALGSYLPAFWGAGLFSMSSVILSVVGGVAGIYAGFKLSQMF